MFPMPAIIFSILKKLCEIQFMYLSDFFFFLILIPLANIPHAKIVDQFEILLTLHRKERFVLTHLSS